MSDDKKLTEFIEAQIKFFCYGQRAAPIQKYPSDAGLEYETVFFPALDGVNLEGWFIPCEGSNKLIICNHPMTFNKGGLPGKQKEFAGFGPIEVDFIPDYKHLHDEGYNLLAYDLRNHGRSGANWGNVVTTGCHESRDAAGAMKFIKSFDKTKNMDVALYPRCMGANATIVAFNKYPEYFKDVVTMVALQPVSTRTFIETGAKAQGLDVEAAVKLYDQKLWEQIGLRLTDVEPQGSAQSVHCPTFVAQVEKDFTVNARKDTQEIFDLLGTSDKDLYWIQGTDRRFDGYNYFPEHPEKLLAWFKKYFPAK